MTIRKHKLQKKHGGANSTRAHKLGVGALTLMQRNFIDEYLIDHNSAASARRAGYAASVAKETARRLKGHPVIAREISRREEDRARRVDISTDQIIRELKAIAFFDVRSLFDATTGQLIANPWSLGEDQLRGLINFEIVVLDSSGTYIVKAVPGAKIRALELLGKYKGLFTESKETSGAQTVTFSQDFGDGAVSLAA